MKGIRAAFRFVIYIFIFLLCFFLFNNFFNSFYKVCSVSIDIEGSNMGARPVEVYYLLSEDDLYDSSNMIGIDSQDTSEFDYDGSINLPVTSTKSFRLDLGDGANSQIKIKELKYRDYSGYWDIDYDAISNSNMNDIVTESVNDDSVALTTTGEDPYIEFKNICLTPYKNYSNIFSAIAAVIASVLIYRYIRLRAVCSMFIDLLESRGLMFSLAKNDFRTKFAGSYFGILWAFVQPVCTILVFWFVFQIGFRSTDIGNVPFICWFICGLIPWFFFSDAWGSATACFQEYSFLVKKVVFKVHILPLVKIISALFVHIFFIAFMICFFLIYRITPNVYWFQVIYYAVCMIALVISLSFVTAPLMVFFKDLGQIMNIILQFGMWLTPIMWSIDRIPDNFMWLFKLNPMYYVVQGYRDSFIYGVPFYNNIKQTLYFWMVVFAMTLIGCLLFRKLKPHFADVL